MVETKFKEPDTNNLAAMNNGQESVVEARQDIDLTAKWLIKSCIEESIFLQISRNTSAYQAWNLLVMPTKEYIE